MLLFTCANMGFVCFFRRSSIQPEKFTKRYKKEVLMLLMRYSFTPFFLHTIHIYNNISYNTYGSGVSHSIALTSLFEGSLHIHTRVINAISITHHYVFFAKQYSLHSRTFGSIIYFVYYLPFLVMSGLPSPLLGASLYQI